MGFIDDTTEELFAYLPPQTKREDFDAFWADTLRQAKAVPLQPERVPAGYPSPYVRVYDISYCGFDRTRIHGWFIVPSFAGKSSYPCLINYHGYTGNRGMPEDFMAWAMQGVAVLSVDCREQSGETGNSAAYSCGSVQSVVSKGLLDKNEYYYRAVYMDCLKAIDFALTCPEVHADRIIIHGGSQGGALGMAVCSLDQRPWLAMLDVPSNSNLERRVEGAHGSFAQVTEYLKKYPDRIARVYETLSYFDTMNMAERIRCPVLASVGLMDNVCPAKCYFASYNRIQSPKDIKLYPFNGHEGGHAAHLRCKLEFLRRHMQAADAQAGGVTP